jgi:hypothetical protein
MMTLKRSLPHFEQSPYANMLFTIESAGRYTHYKQIKLVNYYIEKESWEL